MIEVMYNVPPQFQGPGSEAAAGVSNKGFTLVQRRDFTLSREEHRMKELNLVRSGKRAPRRSQTHYNYQLPPLSSMVVHTIVRQQPQLTEEVSDLSSSCSSDDASQPPSPVPELAEQKPAVRRPALGPPRRSYSVMDSEPLPNIHLLSKNMTLEDMPYELHMAIFDFLDPIDSTCLGLTNKHFYEIHRRMHGIVPLSARRDGPNELEWAWHLASNVVQSQAVPASTATCGDSDHHQNALSKLRVRGQAYCRKCGITRCELHKHIRDWMGEDFEYCSVKRKFGPVAHDGARPYCYMSKPDDPHRCGRHRSRKSKVVLQ